MQLLDLSLKNWAILVALNLVIALILFVSWKIKNTVLKGVFLLIPLIVYFFCYRFFPHLNQVLLWLVAPSLFISFLAYLLSYERKPDPVWDVEINTNKSKKYIRGVQRGVSVFGAAGSGKTISIIYPILKHFSIAKFAGVIYDFKDGELTELALPLFKDNLKTVAIHNPSISYRVNPIAPELLDGEKDINEVVSVIMDNLINNGVGKGDDFFKDSASSLLSSVILKFWFDHKSYCTLPHVISFILGLDFSLSDQGQKPSYNLSDQAQNKFAKLKTFLTTNDRVAIQGSAFIMGLASERQTASVLSTLANALRKISFPEAFWVLSANEIPLDVNQADNRTVISVLNEPKTSKFLSPINATIIHAITKQMMVKKREPSFLVLDEAPTIKLLNMAQIPATMRSFGVATIYCAQDIVQGVVQYGREGFKEILANLSTQFFGKSNDPDTSKFYESYFEMVKEKTRSTSEKGDIFSNGGRTVTIGEKEVSKFRASRFNNLKVGEFAMLSDGDNNIYQIRSLKMEKMPIEEKKHITAQTLSNNFSKILNEVKLLID